MNYLTIYINNIPSSNIVIFVLVQDKFRDLRDGYLAVNTVLECNFLLYLNKNNEKHCATP